MQLCPKCNGEGRLNYPPPWMDPNTVPVTQTVPYSRPCPLCRETGLIPDPSNETIPSIQPFVVPSW